MHLLVDKLNYAVAIVLIMLGLWAMITKRNLVKKLIGMSIFQSAIILFFISMGVKDGATLPIIEHDSTHHGASVEPINPEHYANPLPHVLMLTAIVVGVATLGVALALALQLYKAFGTLEEPEIAARLREEEGSAS